MGNVSTSGASNSRVRPFAKSSPSTGVAARSGYVSAYEIGTRMSGYPRCASEAPSRKRTIAWTTEVGWTTTSICSYGSPNRKCASISSSPLFASVAESIGDLRPHVPRRVGERVGAGHVRQLLARSAAKRAARGCEDDRVDRLEVAPLQALEDRGVLAVDREEKPSTPLPRCERELAGRDEALLVGQRERDAPLERPERRWKAREADDGVQDDVRLGHVQQRREIAADLRVLDAAFGGQPVELARARRERARPRARRSRR